MQCHAIVLNTTGTTYARQQPNSYQVCILDAVSVPTLVWNTVENQGIVLRLYDVG